MKQGLPLAPGMEIGYVVRDASKWEVDSARSASETSLLGDRGLASSKAPINQAVF